MSTTTVGAPPPYAAFYQLSVDKYHQMIDAGILEEGEKVELLEGYLVPKMTIHPPHATALQRVRKRIEARVPAGWDTRIGQPITLLDSEPEPDVAVARGDEATYDRRHPGPSDLGVVIEVAHSSLTLDRVHMARIYARAGIVEYWIVNLIDRQIEVYTQPSGPTAAPAYGHRQDHRPGDSVPLVLDGVPVGQIAVSEVLP
jgi:Uma2 family endonuclease